MREEEGEWLLQNKGFREGGDHNNTSCGGLGHIRSPLPTPPRCAKHMAINNDALQRLQTTF